MIRSELVNKILSGCSKNMSPNALPALSAAIMNTLLAIGSETEDNLNCHKHIEYGMIDAPHSFSVYGLKVKGKAIPIASVMNALEDLPLPTVVKDYFPDLTEHEWMAITRMTTMILISLECARQA